MPDGPAFGLVLDCHDPEVLARFWAAALGYVEVGSVENYAMLLPTDGPARSSCCNASRRERQARTGCTSTLRCPTLRDWRMNSKCWAPSASDRT